MALGWIAAARNSLDGLRHGLRHERPVRQEAVALAAGVLVAPFLARDARHAIVLVAAIALALAVELLNNAVEALADRITSEHDPAIKVAKDSGSAAVAFTILIALALWVEAAWSALARSAAAG